MANKKFSLPTSPSPPWMQGAKEIQGEEMLVVHMSPGELEGLDALQGGPSLDPDTGIREYSALSPIIQIPEVRAIFEHVADEIERHGDISPDLKKVYKLSKSHSLPYRAAPEEKHDPLKEMEETGRGGDTKLALIPLSLAFFLIELRHKPSINPKTGLLEFGSGGIGGFFRKVVKVAATLGGAALGSTIAPGIGTAIGAGLGGFGGSLASGEKPGEALKSGLISGATGYGGAIAGPMGAGIGAGLGSVATGQDLKNAAMSGLTTGAMTYGLQGLGQATGFMGGAPNSLAQWINPTLAHNPASVPVFHNGVPYTPSPVAASSGAGATGSPVASGGAGGIWSTLKGIAPYALPLGALGMAYMGSQKQYQKRKKEYEKEKEAEREEKREYEREKERTGFYEPWRELPVKRKRYNPRFHRVSDLERKYGIFAEPAFEEERGYAKGGLVKSYSKGTLVRGPGKGQDDKIKTSVPEGSYIIDASSTSMFGDGSTKAGSDILSQFENAVKSKFPKGIVREVEKHIYKSTPQLPVWLSEGEYKIDPITVTLLGKGSNNKGASLLKEMVIKLRKHKISNGSGLPPKAKPPAYYIYG